MAKSVRICEVGPRDGFQSIKCAQIPTEQKIEVIDRLIETGWITLAEDMNKSEMGVWKYE